MNFVSHERHYEVDEHGVINQTDPKPFIYDKEYSRIYDTPEYQQQSDILQALRLGFVKGCHGKRIRSLLDCGYGNGAFMKFAKQHIPYVYGLDVTNTPIQDCYIVPEFINADVITFFDSLEHIHDLSFLKSLNCETIIISLPYCHFIVQGKDWFDNNYKHRKPDEHLHHFNEYSLSNVMAANGFEKIAVSAHEDIVRKPKDTLQNILSMAFTKTNRRKK
jgi:hypothetical protein